MSEQEVTRLTELQAQLKERNEALVFTTGKKLDAESEVTRLTEALAAAEHALREANRVSENAIRARDAAEARVRELEADIEAATAESRLTAANALLERIYNWQGPHGLTVTVMNDIRAHLAAQPATAPRCPQCRSVGAHKMDCTDPSRYAQPAAAPECPRCDQALAALSEGIAEAGRLHLRTEAERAVLEAMAARTEAQLRAMASGVWCGHGQDAAIAELARRGLKP